MSAADWERRPHWQKIAILEMYTMLCKIAMKLIGLDAISNELAKRIDAATLQVMALDKAADAQRIEKEARNN